MSGGAGKCTREALPRAAGGGNECMIKMMAVSDEDPLYAARLADYVNQKGAVKKQL